jgi:hypothetical protein
VPTSVGVTSVHAVRAGRAHGLDWKNYLGSVLRILSVEMELIRELPVAAEAVVSLVSVPTELRRVWLV